jgi:hypothetical protein
MSDLPSVTQAIGGFQNGAARAAHGPVAVSADAHRGVRTPTDVMRARRDREARKKAEQDARQREAEGQREQEGYVPDVTEESPTQRRARTRASSGEPQGPQRIGGGQAPTSSGRRPENIPPPSASVPSRSRANTVDQPRPVTSQQPGPEPGRVPGIAATRRPRNDPPEPMNITASQAPQASTQPTQATASQQPEPSTTQPSGRSAFPHAFERWENLSSHWEGLTSYWVRRLQENSNEMNDKPINQQMARQITDLSAAGANLFHAVVELQRLRASSERKFQRWFFETRQEQERAQEVQAELERLLRAERDERANALASIATAQADRMKAEDLVKEMRRELQISKEEARRAWEELGRREQEERERTISLRSGEPTLVGGVQVVPMTQGVPSRQTSTANRPTTRDGPYAGGPGPSTMGGQQIPRTTTNTALDSPADEQRQFTYEPQASSPTETDPFTESAQRSRQHQSQDPELQYYSSQHQPTQPPTTQRSTATSAPSPSRTHDQHTSSGGSGVGSRFYQQERTDTTLLSPTTTNGPSGSLYQTARPSTTASHATDPSDQRSYIPSTASGNGSEFGEEEYEINPDGSYRRDAQGRRVLYVTGSTSGRILSDDGSDEYDVAAELERERLHRERYGTSASRVPPGSVRPPVPSAPAFTEQQQGPSTHAHVTTSQLTGTLQAQEVSPADYTGQAWGEDSYGSSHRHPTRLSDILEERSSMNSPSRASYVSGGPGEPRAGGGDIMGGFHSSRAPQSGR